MPSTPERKTRFRRVTAKNLPHIEINERDLEILKQVAKYRFLRSTHVAALVGGSAQHVVRRLQLLYHHQYLDRIREQLPLYAYLGSKPMVYGVGNQGAQLLSAWSGLPRGKINWAAKNKTVGPIFLAHTLLVADVLVALDVACRKNGAVRLIEVDELLAQAPPATRRSKNPLGWQVPVRYQDSALRLGVIPDRIFGLHFLDRVEGRNKAYFFLEADRATMPVIRTDLRQTSFYRKMLAYYETWKQAFHTNRYGISNFRVLTVTSSPDRVKTLVAANKRLNDGKGSALFLFTDDASVKASEDLLRLRWQSGAGTDEWVTLLP